MILFVYKLLRIQILKRRRYWINAHVSERNLSINMEILTTLCQRYNRQQLIASFQLYFHVYLLHTIRYEEQVRSGEPGLTGMIK